MQNLTVRLEMVFGQVKASASGSSGVRVIDVGSDHGYLALRCLEDGIAKNAVCTEIHEGPARKSQAALKGAGYSEVSEVHVTDGLIGETFGIKFICTFNTSLDDVDPALLRKGRLSLMYEFKPLTVDKVRAFIPDATEPMTVAEIYNREDNNYKEKDTKIGF